MVAVTCLAAAAAPCVRSPGWDARLLRAPGPRLVWRYRTLRCLRSPGHRLYREGNQDAQRQTAGEQACGEQLVAPADGAHPRLVCLLQPGAFPRAAVRALPGHLVRDTLDGACWCVGGQPAVKLVEKVVECRQEARVPVGQLLTDVAHRVPFA